MLLHLRWAVTGRPPERHDERPVLPLCDVEVTSAEQMKSDQAFALY